MADTPTTAGARTGERIAKLLARAGVASRREVERMIADGRVRIGEELVTTPATVLANLKGVTVDGKAVARAEPARLFLFHKPAGLITAERDPAGRPTIYTALRNALPPETPRIMPIGRLDLSTEGLLLLTNDGELKRAMELPANGVPRTYRARTFGDIGQERLEDLMQGIEIDGVRYGPIDANMERRTGRNQWIELTLTEGKNREVRRVLEHLGLQVSRLLRVRYGPFVLGDLPRGAAGEVRQVDVERFAKSLKGLKLPGGGEAKAIAVEAARRGRPAAEARVPESGPARTAAPDRSGAGAKPARKPAPDRKLYSRSEVRDGGPRGDAGARKPAGSRSGGGQRGTKPDRPRGPRKPR
jgi:23S rRNA pseudouridine2605 synthase